MQKSIFTSLFLVLSFCIYSQEKTRFYLTPSLGVQWGFAKFEDKETLPNYIKRLNVPSGARYGIGLLVDFKEKWGLEIGYGGAELGLGIKYASKTDSVESEISGRKIRYTIVHRAYMHWLSPGKLIIIRKRRGTYLRRNAKEKKEYDYLSVFNLGFLGGFAYEFTPPFSFRNNSGTASTITTQDDITLAETNVEIPGEHSMGIYLGIYTQFLNKGEKRLQLGIIYQQGIQKRIISNWSTSINGVEQSDFQTFTRGSYLALYANYPIKFLTLGDKKKLRG